MRKIILTFLIRKYILPQYREMKTRGQINTYTTRSELEKKIKLSLIEMQLSGTEKSIISSAINVIKLIVIYLIHFYDRKEIINILENN